MISDHELGKRFFKDAPLRKLVCSCPGKTIVVATGNGFDARVELRTAMHPKDIWAISATDIKNYDVVKGGGVAPTEYRQVRRMANTLTGLAASACVKPPPMPPSLIESQIDLHSLAHATKIGIDHYSGLTHLSASILLDKQFPRQSPTPWLQGPGVVETNGLSVGDNGAIANTKPLTTFALSSIKSKSRVNFEFKCGLDEWLDFLMVYDMAISTFANHCPDHHHSKANLTIDKDGVIGFSQNFGDSIAPLVSFNCRLTPFESSFVRE